MVMSRNDERKQDPNREPQLSEPGLVTPDLLLKLSEYVRAHWHCPFCGAKQQDATDNILGELEPRSDGHSHRYDRIAEHLRDCPAEPPAERYLTLSENIRWRTYCRSCGQRLAGVYRHDDAVLKLLAPAEEDHVCGTRGPLGPQQQHMRYCAHCGTKLWRFCGVCGRPQLLCPECCIEY